MLNKVECPYCKEQACFFVLGGAFFRGGKDRRVRLRLACNNCRGEFIYIEERGKIEVFGIIDPPGKPLTEEYMTNAGWAAKAI